jgi:hypothetical protein
VGMSTEPSRSPSLLHACRCDEAGDSALCDMPTAPSEDQLRGSGNTSPASTPDLTHASWIDLTQAVVFAFLASNSTLEFYRRLGFEA